MWGSTTPLAMAALAEVFAAAPALAGVAVLDGPTVSSATVNEAIVVGFTSVEDPTAAEGQFFAEGMAALPDREQYTIRCAALVTSGSTGDVAVARVRAFELLSAVGGVLATNQTLNGAVMRARLADVTLQQEQATNGLNITVNFGVSVDAFTTK